MTDPLTWAIAGTALSTVGSFSAARAQSQQYRAEAAAADYRAAVAEQQAAREREVANQEAADFQRENLRRISTLRARTAGAGVRLEGTPLLVEQDIAGEIARGTQRILHGGDINAIRLEQEAQLDRMTGRSARRAAGSAFTTGLLRAGGSLATGIADIDFASGGALSGSSVSGRRTARPAQRTTLTRSPNSFVD